jgi:DNA polymerase III alpha subunit
MELPRNPFKRALMPLQINPRDGSVITQFPMGTLESLGLLKMDFLGLRNLTVMRHTLELIRQTRGFDLDLDSLGFNDENVAVRPRARARARAGSRPPLRCRTRRD